MDSKLTIPTVHLNGSGRERLLRSNTDAARAARDLVRAIDKTLDAFSEAEPHGRDYYVQPGNAYEQARDQHVARLRVLQDAQRAILQIADEFRAIAEGIEEQ